MLQDDTNAINLFRRAMATVRERKRLGKVILGTYRASESLHRLDIFFRLMKLLRFCDNTQVLLRTTDFQRNDSHSRPYYFSIELIALKIQVEILRNAILYIQSLERCLGITHHPEEAKLVS